VEAGSPGIFNPPKVQTSDQEGDESGSQLLTLRSQPRINGMGSERAIRKGGKISGYGGSNLKPFG